MIITQGFQEKLRTRPLAGGRSPKCTLVESPGVEPGSKQETNMISTCLSFYWLSGEAGKRQPTFSLFP